MRYFLLFLTLWALACGDKDGSGTTDTSEPSVDSDGDGFSSAEDCDDSDADVHPEAEEGCNGVDDNCDGEVDEGVTTTWYADIDSDFYGDPAVSEVSCEAPNGYVENALDCDDTSGTVNPNQPEVCDGVDNNCDGVVDEDSAVDAQEFFADIDGDGHGNPVALVTACEIREGLSADDTDCDDTHSSVYPDAPLICGDGVVNDCNDTEAEELAECAANGSQRPTALSTDQVLVLSDYDYDTGYASGTVAVLDVDGDNRDDVCVRGNRTNSFIGLYCYTDWLDRYVDQDGLLEDAASYSDVRIEHEDASRYFAKGNTVNVQVGGDNYIVVSDRNYIDADGVRTGAAYIYTDVSQVPVGTLEGDRYARIFGAYVDVETPMALGDELLAVGRLDAGNASLERTGCIEFINPSIFTEALPTVDVATLQFCGEGGSLIDEFGAAVATGDLTGDGNPETVICAPGALRDNGQCFVFSAQAAGVYTSLSASLTLRGDNGERFGSTVELADVTGDGALDIIVGAPEHYLGAGEEGVVYVFTSGGTTSWTQRSQIDSADADVIMEGYYRRQYFGGRLATGDFNGDGLTDLFVGSYDGPSLDIIANQVDVFLNTGTGLGTEPWLRVSESADGLSTDMPGSNFVVADVNGDGASDLLTVHSDRDALFIWLGGSI
jgi:hypothetical protein